MNGNWCYILLHTVHPYKMKNILNNERIYTLKQNLQEKKKHTKINTHKSIVGESVKLKKLYLLMIV